MKKKIYKKILPADTLIIQTMQYLLDVGNCSVFMHFNYLSMYEEIYKEFYMQTRK